MCMKKAYNNFFIIFKKKIIQTDPISWDWLYYNL